MSLAGIFLFLIFLIIVIVGGVFLFRSSKKGEFVDGLPSQALTPAQRQANIAYNSFLPQPAWGKFTPNTTPDGNCLAYSSPAAQFVPIPATYQGLNISSGRGYVSSTQSCLDADQIFAQAGAHTCEFNNSGSAGSACILSVPTIVNGVLMFPGDTVPKGTVEGLYNGAAGTTPYYIGCNYSDTAATNDPSSNPGNLCGGDIGLIVPNYTPLSDYQDPASNCNVTGDLNYCISLDTNLPLTNTRYFEVKLAACDMGNFEQIFRVVRYSIDTSYNLTQDNKGILAAIVYRQNGYFLAPNLAYDLPTNQYIFDYLLKNAEMSTKAKTDTVDLILINPNFDTVRNGVYWLLQDQLPDPEYDLATIPPQQYYGCNIGPFSIGSEIKGCDLDGIPNFYRYANGTLDPPSGFDNYDVITPISPQQIIYIPSLYQLPTTPLTDPQGYWAYLTNLYSINMYKNIIDPTDLTNYLGLQTFRKNTPSKVYYDSSGITATVQKYTPGKFPIAADNTKIYTDTQFLQYTNMPNAIETGLSPVSPGCKTPATNFNSNTYNPIVPGNSTLVFTPANNPT